MCLWQTTRIFWKRFPVKFLQNIIDISLEIPRRVSSLFFLRNIPKGFLKEAILVFIDVRWWWNFFRASFRFYSLSVPQTFLRCAVGSWAKIKRTNSYYSNRATFFMLFCLIKWVSPHIHFLFNKFQNLVASGSHFWTFYLYFLWFSIV